MKIRLKTFSLLFLTSTLALAPLPSWAQGTSVAASTPEQAQQVPSGKFIQDLGNHAIGVIADASLSQEQRNVKYHDLLHEAFDMKTIGHFVAGRALDAAPPEQQQEYMKLFEQLVVKIYSDRLNFYSGEKFIVKAVRPENDRDMIVGSEISHTDGSPPTHVDWRVRQKDGKFAIIDVVIAGVSQSVTQRQEYASVIQRDGGKLDGLLDLMRQRIQSSSANTSH